MRTIIKSLVVVSALVAGGSAFAGEVGDTAADQATVKSQLQFSAQAANRAYFQAAPAQRQGAVVVPADPRQTIIETVETTRGANN